MSDYFESTSNFFTNHNNSSPVKLPTRLEFSPLQKLYMARYEKWIWSSDLYHYFGYISYTASISSTMTLVLLVLGTINT